MRTILFLCLWTALLSNLSAVALELIGNYPLWNSPSNLLIYDVTGNNNHGNICSSNRYFTDRGLKLNGGCALLFPSNNYKTFPGYTQMTVSYWYLKSSSETYGKYFGVVNTSLMNNFGVWIVTGLITEIEVDVGETSLKGIDEIGN